ncbi:hypothetical protein [Imbroritus primus]|uniref:hypothetical protein n=1 Tax=Imbroritus primus TaxID=3058603 RepID=UPI003D161CFC
MGVLVITTAFAACAQTTAEHAQHHPDGAATANTRPAPATPEAQMSAIDRQLRLMQDMSRKLANARTPQERQALMTEHRKTMQDSMQMMGQMQDMPMPGMGMRGDGMMMGAGMAGGPASSPSATPGGAARRAPGMGPQMMERMMQRHAMMEKRMEMMQAMMQMMMESMPAAPAR